MSLLDIIHLSNLFSSPSSSLPPPLSPSLPLPFLLPSLPSPSSPLSPPPLPSHTGAVLFISTVSILISLFQTRRHLQQLHDLVALSCTVNILRDGKGEGKESEERGREKEGGSSYQRSGVTGYCKELFSFCSFSPEVRDVPSESLVPGDVLVVPPTGMMVPCDAVLLSGHTIVNEAMLTGANHVHLAPSV